MSDEQWLERAVEALREEVPVRPEWRTALERELRDAPVPVRPRIRGWRVSPVMAIAAALVCMAGGVALDQAWQQARPSGTSSVNASTVGVRFSVLAPRVRRVTLVGDFNGWDANATPLTLARDGQTWTTLLPLASGRHAYAFVIDGEVVRDPAAPAAPDDDFGVPNSLLLVSATR